jgi:histidyl-tRNA synthetase
VAVVDEESREASASVAAALRSRGIACEVAPAADKFGKQIRYADRRGIPFVWFPEADGHSVKDIRTGDQQGADPDSWEPPDEDRVPQVCPTPSQEARS